MLLVKSRESKNSAKFTKLSRGCVLLPLVFSNFSFAQSTQSITNPTSVLSIFLSLLLVVGIIFSLAYVMRRFNVTHSGSGQMKVVASMMAGAKEKIMVIEVGEEQHLVGITAHNISHLSKLEKPIESVKVSMGGGDQFKQKLIKAMAGRLNPNAKGNGHES